MTMLVSLKDKMGKAVMRRLFKDIHRRHGHFGTSATNSSRERLSPEWI
jgi:hypothetical protein